MMGERRRVRRKEEERSGSRNERRKRGRRKREGVSWVGSYFMNPNRFENKPDVVIPHIHSMLAHHLLFFGKQYLAGKISDKHKLLMGDLNL
jgi:hypothetical protein